MFGSFSKIANGNIAPCRFVRLDTSNEGRVVQSGAGEDIWGISQPYERRHTLLSDGYAAIAGENVNVIGPGDDEALLDLGGTVSVGDYLKADANGKGVVGSTDKDKTGAVALTAGVSGDRIKVKPIKLERSV